MTQFVLVRHGMNDTVGRSIAGRSRIVRLNEVGRAEAERVAARLSQTPLSAVCSGPLPRVIETAEPIARVQGLSVEIREGLDEIDFGEWTGLDYATLESDPAWKTFNTYRSGARPPCGELMVEVQSRMVSEVERLRALYEGGTVAIVSHGDPLKMVIGYYIGIPVELLHRIELSTGSITVLSLSSFGSRLLRLNDTGRVLPV